MDHDFVTLWQASRRAAPADRGALLAILREHADVWQRRLRFLLLSPDARDRILVLQVISTQELALQFRHDLQQLLDDPVEGIRRLTKALLDTVATMPLSPRRPVTGSDSSPRDDEFREAARNELNELMSQLADTECALADAQIVGRIRELLRSVHDANRQESAEPAEVAEASS